MKKRRLLVVASAHQSLHWFTIGLMVPILALLQLEKGLDLFQIGLTVAVYSGTVIALELPTGGLADSIGRKKVYLYSLAFKAIGIAVLLFARSFAPVLIGFLFFGLARALSSGTMDAWFVDEFNRLSPQGNLQSALATIGVFIPIGLGIGSIAGGILPDTLGPITARIRFFDLYSSNLLAMAALLLVQILFTAALIEDHHAPAGEAGLRAGFRSLPQVLATSIRYGIHNRTVLMLLLSTAALGLTLSGLENFWQPRLKQIMSAASQTWIFGLLSAGYFLAASLGNAIITPICRLFGNRYTAVLFVTRICMGAIWFLLALQSRVAGFAAFYVAVFLFNGLAASPQAAIFNAQIPEQNRSTLLSFGSLVLQLGAALGAVAMGYISKTRSIPLAWQIGSVFLVISAAAYLFIPRSGACGKEDGG